MTWQCKQCFSNISVLLWTCHKTSPEEVTYISGQCFVTVLKKQDKAGTNQHRERGVGIRLAVKCVWTDSIHKLLVISSSGRQPHSLFKLAADCQSGRGLPNLYRGWMENLIKATSVTPLWTRAHLSVRLMEEGVERCLGRPRQRDSE